jgi:hypothetical protein
MTEPLNAICLLTMTDHDRAEHCLPQSKQFSSICSISAAGLTKDSDILSFFDLSDPGLFYFPDTRCKERRVGLQCIGGDTTSSSTLSSGSSERSEVKECMPLGGTETLPPWDIPDGCLADWVRASPILCPGKTSSSNYILHAEGERTVLEGEAAGSEERPQTTNGFDLKCDACGRYFKNHTTLS